MERKADIGVGNDGSFLLGDGNFVVHMDHVNLRLMLQLTTVTRITIGKH